MCWLGAQVASPWWPWLWRGPICWCRSLGWLVLAGGHSASWGGKGIGLCNWLGMPWFSEVMTGIVGGCIFPRSGAIWNLMVQGWRTSLGWHCRTFRIFCVSRLDGVGNLQGWAFPKGVPGFFAAAPWGCNIASGVWFQGSHLSILGGCSYLCVCPAQLPCILDSLWISGALFPSV